MPWQGTNVVDPYSPPLGWWHDLGLNGIEEFVDTDVDD
jgi:hypothetical protein